ncbi:hypothetical protein CLTEP_17410 [Clostridium tepidiprofundi DSM 19306]|uniref:Uncharacterized protein n=1 Tax=Clostridium tepidiprofundi DSM 19306 TaxID=1121338 RepID=A0A151B343_9CLOT|nr:hypothetical protein [Clostridium tepidiprofundi]KYH34316.1 hypothetical protein CLTEP_17410 [Clostridium tepidiprofundi DSM 19306]
MWSFLIFICIIIVFIFVSRKNMINRANELSSNADSFSRELKRNYFSLDSNLQEKFLASLTQKEKNYFNMLLNNDKLNYGKFVWSIQQHLITQQDIMNKLKKIADTSKKNNKKGM